MNLQEQIKTLDQECTKVEKQIQQGLNWVVNNVPSVNKKGVIYNLKKYRRANERYKIALQKRPVIAIFGESQVGKSYLVSNLAIAANEDVLNIVDPSNNGLIDFIKEMNPKGGGAEATGLVSRFTIVNNYKAGQAPFLLKLLSQDDVVKIISNGYLSDIMLYNYKIDNEEIQKRLQNVRKKMMNTEQPGFTEDDAYELKEYLNYQFKDHFIVRDLNNINFWDDVATIAPFLPSEMRYEIFEIIWGKHEFFTDLFNNLSYTLKQLNFLEEVRCNRDALTPQESTILDVSRLKEMYLPQGQTTIDVFSQDGKTFKVTKSIISALTAEVVLLLPDNIVDDPMRAFLKEADVLDFPGARSRKKIPEITFLQNDKKDKLEVYLRGKIAFLFDRYTYENEISSLIYCMHEKQSEVQDLPRLIHEWIKVMHGGSPEERENSENHYKKLIPQTDIERIIPLLVVMTKFNIELTGSTSDVIGQPDSHNEKWTARLQKNFNDFMSMNVEDKWPNAWTLTERYFQNIFLLRDPKYSKAIYEGITENNTGQETKIRPEYEQRLKDMEISFLKHQAVQKHIRNKELLWKETTMPSKSGIDYIVKYLSPTCNPILRIERIKTFIQQLIQDIQKELEVYFEGDDVGEKLKKANLNSAKVFMFLNKWNTETSAFGYFLERLTIHEDEAWQVYWNLQNSAVIDDKPRSKANNSQMLITLKDTFKTFGISFSDEKTIEDNLEELQQFLGINKNELKEILETNGIDLEQIIDKADEQIKSKTEIYVESLLANWISKLTELKGQDILTGMGMSKEIYELMYKEFMINKERVNLKKILVENTDNEIKNFAYSNNFDIVAHISASIINDFVRTLGWKYLNESDTEYPKLNNNPIFSKLPCIVLVKEELKIDIRYPGMELFSQWVMGIKESFKANVLFMSNMKSAENAIASQELGKILEALKNAVGQVRALAA